MNSTDAAAGALTEQDSTDAAADAGTGENHGNDQNGGNGNGRRIRKGERSRMRILDAAARLLSCRGYAATTLTDIAAAAEMQAGSLYYHFDSKDAIVEEVLRVGIDHARNAIDASLVALGPDAQGSERLAEAIVAYVNCIVAESSFTVANIRCYNESPPHTREQLTSALREFTDLWVGLLAEGQADGSLRDDTNPKVLARLMISGLNSLASWYRPGGPLRLDDLARQFAGMVLHGLHPAD
ncbi:TetR/AcrR family transcriptional regulator [Candidatus Poriferisodalis sp.]|uniref:TetR/AcrR family transcriptional regulator n=1 Tax=Candidatus Poriferisodalis sp. TaxID=3101277 RepID=UPI003B01732B